MGKISLFNKKTIHDIDVSNKKVLVRVDYNVPLEHGLITDDYRISKSLPTIKYLVDNNAKVVLISHLGRPDGRVDKSLSLAGCARRLSKLINKDVAFSTECTGEVARSKISKLKSGDVLLLENLRFHPEEEQNDENFAKELADGFDYFVQDGFGVVHRAHASTEAITKFLPSVAGLLVESEVCMINKVVKSPNRPLMAIIGGAKIVDKLLLIKRFIEIADVLAIGGAMANTFLMASGTKVGESLVDKDELPLAREIIGMARERAKTGKFVFYLPQDGVVAESVTSQAKTRIVDWGTHAVAEIENYPSRPPKEDYLVDENEKILDIGPFSGAFIAGSMQLANTVVWNGTMGVTETDSLHSKIGPFSHGTELIMEAMMGQFGRRPFTLVGGGDTAGYLEHRKVVDLFDHVSTGGGASLELLSGKKLPGLEALEDKND